MLSSAIQKAQEKIESNNFGIRKNLLEYDQVMNEQREIIYEERRHVLDGDNMRDSIFHMMNDYIENTVDMIVSPDQDYEEFNLVELNRNILETIPMEPLAPEDVKGLSPEEAETSVKRACSKSIRSKRGGVSRNQNRYVRSSV